MSANKFYWLLSPTGTDDGATFAAILETGLLDFGSPSRTKYIRRILILGHGKFLVQYLKDAETAVDKTDTVDMTSSQDTWNLADLWGTGAWGPDAVIKDIEVNPDLYGRFFQLRFTDAETTLGKKLLELGSREFVLASGEWGIYQTVIDGNVLGKRGS
jgi:hypothetical protein